MGKKRLTTKEFHDVLLKTLLHFDKFCRERDIVYSLAYGTLLGAIRHKGFIPWDDDIDICMDRENYDKFEKDWKEHITNCDNENYQLWPEMDENSFFAAFVAKFFDKRTELVETIGKHKVHYGVYIDIFVFDYLPLDELKQKKILQRNKFYGKMLDHFIRHGQKWNQWVKKYHLPLLSSSTFVKKILKLKYDCNNKYRDTGVIANYQGFGKGETSRLNDSIFDRNMFKTIEYVSFEGHLLPVTSYYDSVLKYRYGNYMELPPKSEQKGHNVEVYWNV